MSSTQVVIEPFILDDGRRAERHTTTQENGNITIEVFAEDIQPFKLEQRIVREFKTIVAKETHMTIKNGEVVALKEVKAPEGGNYMHREELEKMISDISRSNQPSLPEQSFAPVIIPQTFSAPVISAQALIEKNIEEKNSSKKKIIWILGVFALVELTAFLGYVFYM